jgi:hypothetical protein
MVKCAVPNFSMEGIIMRSKHVIVLFGILVLGALTFQAHAQAIDPAYGAAATAAAGGSAAAEEAATATAVVNMIDTAIIADTLGGEGVLPLDPLAPPSVAVVGGVFCVFDAAFIPPYACGGSN